MKLIFALVSLLFITGCGQRSGGDTVGQAAGTTSEMQGRGSNSSNPGALDSNGMATVSGTTQAAGAAPVDPQAGRDDSTSTSSRKDKSVKQSSSDAVKSKMNATRPGTEHDMSGGNDTGTGSSAK